MNEICSKMSDCVCMWQRIYIDRLVQDYSNSIAYTLELQ